MATEGPRIGLLIWAFWYDSHVLGGFPTAVNMANFHIFQTGKKDAHDLTRTFEEMNDDGGDGEDMDVDEMGIAWVRIKGQGRV